MRLAPREHGTSRAGLGFILAMLAVLLLAGCGHAGTPKTSTPKDPFVGTWLTNMLYNGDGYLGMSVGVVITKSEAGYRVVRVYRKPGSAEMVTPLSDPMRRGETLFATETLSEAYPGPWTIRWALTYISNPKDELAGAMVMRPTLPYYETPPYLLTKTPTVSPSP
jgi:hypothetical protein